MLLVHRNHEPTAGPSPRAARDNVTWRRRWRAARAVRESSCRGLGSDVIEPFFCRGAPVRSVGRVTGAKRLLARLAEAETPTLLCFWAPWCEVCSHDAPAIQRLAADAGDDLAVIAIGGRDDAANGLAFVTHHRLRAPTILFDERMAAWQAYAIPGQPAGVLLDRDGRERGHWLGAFDSEEVPAARGL
jgi:thiol-disulfide isomerase/thioredoxin